MMLITVAAVPTGVKSQRAETHSAKTMRLMLGHWATVIRPVDRLRNSQVTIPPVCRSAGHRDASVVWWRLTSNLWPVVHRTRARFHAAAGENGATRRETGE